MIGVRDLVGFGGKPSRAKWRGDIARHWIATRAR